MVILTLERSWDPSLATQDIYEAGRAAWRLGAGAEGERLALIIGGGIVRVAVEIDEWTREDGGGRRSFTGRLLGPGDAVHDRFVGQPDPSGSASRNPARYWIAPDLPGQYVACLCGCGVEVRNQWLPGHDQRAIHQRIRRDFQGSVARFIAWYDQAARGDTLN
jgi:hypothetical protein